MNRGEPTKEIALVLCEGPGDRRSGRYEVRGWGFGVRFFDQGVNRNPRVVFGGKAFPLD